MRKHEDRPAEAPMLKAKGILKRNGVKIQDKSAVDELSQRGYGVPKKKNLTLAFYEALYLVDKELLEVQNEEGKTASFREVLRHYEGTNPNAWACYLVYRD